MGERDVLFVDEIHRLPAAAEEMLYSAMEDFRLDLIVGAQAGQPEAVSIPLPRFTLVGATTRQGMLSAPLLARFGITLRLDYYSTEELERVVHRAAGLLDLDIAPAATREIASRSRGTPRIAGRLLRRVRDFAIAAGTNRVSGDLARSEEHTSELQSLMRISYAAFCLKKKKKHKKKTLHQSTLYTQTLTTK